MKKALFLVLPFIFLLFGCGDGSDKSSAADTGGSDTLGAIAFNLDLAKVLAEQNTLSSNVMALAAPTPTRATITMTRTGYATIESELTIVDNIASGIIENIPSGPWHVVVDVFDNLTPIISSETDIIIQAGVQVECVLYVDPAAGPDGPGSVVINLEINPLPGHLRIPQFCDIVLAHDGNLSVHVLDRSKGVIGVYDSTTLQLIEYHKPSMAVTQMAYNFDHTGLILASESGNVYELSNATGQPRFIHSTGFIMGGLFANTLNSIAVWGIMLPPMTGEELRIINATDGAILDSRTGITFGIHNSVIFNQVASRAYVHDTFISPVYSIESTANGLISSIDEKWPMQSTGKLFLADGVIFDSNGNMYSSSPVPTDDFSQVGSLQIPISALSHDSMGGLIYATTPGTPTTNPELIVLDARTYLPIKRVAILGHPIAAFHTATTVGYLTEDGGNFFGKVFTKLDLGL